MGSNLGVCMEALDCINKCIEILRVSLDNPKADFDEINDATEAVIDKYLFDGEAWELSVQKQASDEAWASVDEQIKEYTPEELEEVLKDYDNLEAFKQTLYWELYEDPLEDYRDDLYMMIRNQTFYVHVESKEDIEESLKEIEEIKVGFVTQLQRDLH